MSSNIITVEHLVKEYGDFKAVDNISFEVKEGDFFGFLGPNGAGKTTTMRILSTLLNKTKGKAVVAGFDIDTDPEGVRRSIGFAMQDISLDNLASAYENLELLGVLYGLTKVQARARADELLEVVGLKNVATNWVNTYSGGMRRRLDLAGVLMHRPKLLFLDEPTQGLDPQARRVIWDYLIKLNEEGSTIFLTTHFMDEADFLCRNIAFIDKGKIVRQGTPAKLKAEMGGDVLTLKFDTEEAVAKAVELVKKALPAAKETAVRDHSVVVTLKEAGKEAPKLLATLSEAKLQPLSLSITEPTLEDMFVKLVGRSLLEEDNKLVKGHDPFVEGRR